MRKTNSQPRHNKQQHQRTKTEERPTVPKKQPLQFSTRDLKPIDNVCDVINGVHPQVRLTRKDMEYTINNGNVNFINPAFEWSTDGEHWYVDANIQLFNSPTETRFGAMGDSYKSNFSVDLSFKRTDVLDDFKKYIKRLNTVLNYNLLSIITGVKITKDMKDNDFISRVVKVVDEHLQNKVVVKDTNDKDSEDNEDEKDDKANHNISVREIFKRISQTDMMRTGHLGVFNHQVIHGYKTPKTMRSYAEDSVFNFTFGPKSRLVKIRDDGSNYIEHMTDKSYNYMKRDNTLNKCSVIFAPVVETNQNSNGFILKLKLKVRQLYVDNRTKVVESSWFMFSD